MKNSTVETLIGAVVIAIAAAFFAFAYQTSGATANSGGYRLTAEFDNAEGINIGTDVRMAGVKVGTVIDQRLNYENFQAVIAMAIDPKLELADDTTAKVTAEGLLGSKFIALEPGGSETKLSNGDVIAYTQGAVDVWSLISQAMFERSGAKSSGDQRPDSRSDETEPPPDTQAQ
jgi:phospholipid/cholesterol/gamma-HCH transport system substrate-binding protein